MLNRRFWGFGFKVIGFLDVFNNGLGLVYLEQAFLGFWV